MNFISLHSHGIIMDDLPSSIYKELLSALNEVDTTKKHNRKLAGNIKEEYTFPNGAIYKGQWKKGFRHGYGVQTWPGTYCFCYYL